LRHRKAGLKLNRTTSHRDAMFRNMVTSLFKYDRIRTTDVKAKELRRWADRLVTLAKRGDLHARRQALSIIREKNVVHQLFDDAAERFGDRSGGYTRLSKIGFRPGDAASMTLVELVAVEKSKKKKKAPKKAEPVKKAEPEEKKADDPEAVTDKVKEPAVEAKETTPAEPEAEGKPEEEVEKEPEIEAIEESGETPEEKSEEKKTDEDEKDQ
jgi:large subunit ribosomal protein L17